MNPEHKLILIEKEFDRLTEEIRSRYNHHYHFHYIVLVVLGIVAAVLTKENINEEIKIYVYLSLPIVISPIVLLMLKEHAYMDLREAYIENVLRKEISNLLKSNEADSVVPLSWFSWEQLVLSKSKKSFIIFGVYGLSEYMLPLLIMVLGVSLSVYNMASTSSIVPLLLLYIDLIVLAGICLFIVYFRVKLPHLDNIKNIAQQDIQPYSQKLAS